MKRFFYFLVLAIVFGGVILASQAQAQGGVRSEIEQQMGAAGGSSGAGLTSTDPRVIVTSVIIGLLSLVGIVILGFMVYAGFLWMTAGGNDEQITTAKSIIRNATIGLIIVLSAYSITWFIVRVALGDYSGRPVYLLDRVFQPEQKTYTIPSGL